MTGTSQPIRRPLRVLLVSQYLDKGGAARAALRVFRALKLVENDTGVYPTLRVIRGATSEPGIISGLPPKIRFPWVYWMKVHLSRLDSRYLFRGAQPGLHSVAAVRSGLAEEINAGGYDLVNLHWLGDATLSIEEIGEIEPPVVWTLHDMWVFSGAEHQSSSRRFVEGYTPTNRPAGEKGLDVNRRTWRRKVRAWRKDVHVIAPSEWIAEQASESALLNSGCRTVIPHPLDVSTWTPRPGAGPKLTPTEFPDQPLRIGFGMDRGAKWWVKGVDRIPEIAEELSGHPALQSRAIEFWFFGGAIPGQQVEGVTFRNFGPLDDGGLVEFFRGLDVVCVPSRLETFGLVAAEAISCGVPVVGFRDTGVASVVRHLQTGYLAEWGNFRDIAEGIAWLLKDPKVHRELSRNCRIYALNTWGPSRIGALYAALFREILDRHKGN